MEEKQTATPAGLDAEKIVKCLRMCADEDFRTCRECDYRADCNQLILDAIALLEAGYDLRKEKAL